MKTTFILALIALVMMISCNQEKSSNNETTEKNDKTGKITVDSKGLEIKTCYYAIDDSKNKIEDAIVPFGKRLLFVFDDFSGLTEVEGKYYIGFKISIYEGEKLLRHSDDVFANDPGISPEDLTFIYAYVDAYYPIRPGKTFTFKAEIWDKNSENKALVSGDFEMKDEVPGSFEIENNGLNFASVILKKNREIATDNIFHPGDTVRIYLEGVSGFVAGDEGYSFVGSYFVTDAKGEIIVPETGEEINIAKMDRLFSSIPVNKVLEPSDIYWIIKFKDNIGDAEISVKAKLHLEP